MVVAASLATFLCLFPRIILLIVVSFENSCLFLSHLVLASGFCVTVHSVCMYSRKPVLDHFSGHIYLEKLLCKFQQNVNSYMFWTFCIEEWLEVRSHSGLIILTQFQTLPLKRIVRGESLLLPWYAPDHPDPVQPVSVVRDRLAGFHVHLLTQRNSCFVPGPTPSSWQPSEPPFPVYQLFQFQPQPLQLQFNMSCYLILLVPLAPHGYHPHVQGLMQQQLLELHPQA